MTTKSVKKESEVKTEKKSQVAEESVQKPSIGRIVIYNTTDDDRAQTGSFNNCNSCLQLPAIIVNVWNDTCVNLKVIVDGSIPDIWKTSVCQGKKEGFWDWPVKK